MPLRTFRAVGRLAGNIGSAALGTLSEGLSLVTNVQVSAGIERLADKFEPVTVPVRCVPVAPGANDNYELDVDMTGLEAALAGDRFVRPALSVSAATTTIDRAILTDRLIEKFGAVLKRHEERMEEVAARRQQAIDREARELNWKISETIFDFLMNAAIAALVGLGALVGPMFWLLVAVGGFAVLTELPDLVWKLLRRAVGLSVYERPEDEELAELSKELERYRPILERLVRDLDIVEDVELAAKQAELRS